MAIALFTGAKVWIIGVGGKYRQTYALPLEARAARLCPVACFEWSKKKPL
jgi:hypothetical protein